MACGRGCGLPIGSSLPSPAGAHPFIFAVQSQGALELKFSKQYVLNLELHDAGDEL